MKATKLILSVFILTLFSCDNNNLSGAGKVVFYTNAQAMLNCGNFNVDVYVDNRSVGSISEPYVEDNKPASVTTASTLMLEKKTGNYSYTAKLNCGQYGEWHGTVDILPDSTICVFLDIHNCNTKSD